jgi:hypothetical protein
MVRYTEISDLSEILGEGFFADRVISTLDQHKQMSESDREILERILKFIEKIEKGQRQVNTGRLSSDAMESITAYYRAIVALHAITGGTKEAKLDELISKIKEEVEDTLRKKEIIPSKLRTTHTFFEFIQDATLHEAGNYYGSRVEVFNWRKKAP